jgi:hypothetical protein
MVSDAQTDAFYEGRRSESLPLAVNDVVTVTWGKRVGVRAWVISLRTIHPEPSYLVEYEEGSDEVVPLSSIRTHEA